jgi:hypothetical protein
LHFDGMKRTLAALVTALLLLPAFAAERARGATEVWASDHVFTEDFEAPPGAGIKIAAGVNLTFAPPTLFYYFQTLRFAVSGPLGVCGTAGEPVAIRGVYPTVPVYRQPAANLSIAGNGLPGQVSFQNCTLQNITVSVDSASGAFRDCTFVNCTVYTGESPLEFWNCSFLSSTIHLSNTVPANGTLLRSCVFNGTALPGTAQPGFNYSYQDAINIYGHARVEDCLVSGYEIGLYSFQGLPVVARCTFLDCLAGLAIITTDPGDTPSVEDTAAGRCTVAGAYVAGNIRMANCTLSLSETGLVLQGNRPEGPADWTLSGNRVFGNDDYGIEVFALRDFDPGDTVFDDGAGRPNGLGRVSQKGELSIRLYTPGGDPPDDVVLNLTDAFGNRTSVMPMGHGLYQARSVPGHILDNSGQRTDFYPYKVRAEWREAFCETVVLPGTANVTLVMETLPDLIPAGLSIDPPRPRAGQWVVISCLVKNTGPTNSTRVQAVFTLDDERLDLSEVYPVGPHSCSTVRAVDWKARPGVHTVTVRLDPDGLQEENDKSNNNITFYFTVAPAPPPAVRAPDVALFGAAAVILAAAGAAGFMLWRRRKRPGGA